MSWLQEKRSKKGLTQKEVAKKVGINRASLSKLENGNTNPSVRLAKMLGDVLDFEWTRFYEADPDEEAEEEPQEA